MGFVVFSFLTWLFISILTVIKKKLSLVENTLVYLIILIVSINFSWIVIEELKLISLSRKGFDYTSFLLNRSIIIPVTILIQLNLLEWSKSPMKKILVFIASVVVLVLFEVISNLFNLTEYKHWNYGFDAIYFVILNLIAILSYKLFTRVSRNEVNYT